MKVLIASTILTLLPHVAALGQEVFASWKIFPGPNPEVVDLLTDADPETVFRIGQIIFDYPFDRTDKIDQPVQELSELQSVADVVKAATPGPALVALVDQQLSTPHQFHFEEAAVLDYGDVGYIWHVTYSLYPKNGGFSGVPFQYRAVLDGQGNIISPRMTIFDTYFHSPEDGWTCSVLHLPENQVPKEMELSAEVIRKRATEILGNSKVHTTNQTVQPLSARMKHQNQKLINIPVSTLASGELVNVDLWAVNFRDISRKERPDELFTVWVTKDGRTAEIGHLDH